MINISTVIVMNMKTTIVSDLVVLKTAGVYVQIRLCIGELLCRSVFSCRLHC